MGFRGPESVGRARGLRYKLYVMAENTDAEEKEKVDAPLSRHGRGWVGEAWLWDSWFARFCLQ